MKEIFLGSIYDDGEWNFFYLEEGYLIDCSNLNGESNLKRSHCKSLGATLKIENLTYGKFYRCRNCLIPWSSFGRNLLNFIFDKINSNYDYNGKLVVKKQ